MTERRSRPDKIAAFCAASHSNLGFIIVDGCFIALQIGGIDPVTKTLQYEGGLFIEDPHGEIVPQFKRTFEKIRNSGRAVNSSDFQ